MPLNRLMRAPVAPVRHQAGHGVLASAQMGKGRRNRRLPKTIVRHFIEQLECCDGCVTRVKGRVPVAARFNATVGFHVVALDPRDQLLRIAQIRGVAPLLVCHDQGNGGIEFCVASRAASDDRAFFVVDFPIHALAAPTIAAAAVKAFTVALPVFPKLVEFRLVVVCRTRHIHHNEHAVADAFGNGVFGVFVRANHAGRTRRHACVSVGGSACIFLVICTLFCVPSAFPHLKMALERVNCGRFERVAVGVGLVLGKWELRSPCKGEGCRRKA